MLPVQSHLSYLGKKGKDRVTGFTGTVTTVGFDLYGCIQVVLTPGLDKDGVPASSNWFDIGRIEITDNTPVMPQPDFDFGSVAEGKKGPAAKPTFGTHPPR